MSKTDIATHVLALTDEDHAEAMKNNDKGSMVERAMLQERLPPFFDGLGHSADVETPVDADTDEAEPETEALAMAAE